MAELLPGSPHPLGATPTARGVNVAVFSRHAERIEVCTWQSPGDEPACHVLPGRTGDIWHGLLPPSSAVEGTRYALRAHGPFEPQHGHRFDGGRLLLDPFARELVLPPGGAPHGRIRGTEFDWDGDRPPSVPWRETLIYELHVKGFTRLHPQVPPEWRGTYLGLTCPAVLGHLRELGVTAVELLPVHGFISEPFLEARGLSNYWGYNPLAWFAPAPQYAFEDPLTEFKIMVKALHGAGIEVILDMVFNHTAEGNEEGPTLSLKGLDNAVYYRLLREDKRFYENLTGCGNTVNCADPAVRHLIIDCLRYWVEDMHVDGFRFDLATVLARDDGGFNGRSPLFDALRAEPSLAYVKLIAEPWDIGLGGYQLGQFPAGWSEWNDRYRDQVRAFWNTDAGRVGDLAERVAGSSDVFRHRGRKPSAGINFITAHDGFTLRDLVSYNHRRNEANLEDNRDGHSHNLSWNCGAEGETGDADVTGLRLRMMMNFLATLLLSQGVPMLQAGDELGRTQAGNNNAYCQDNAISWVDWALLPSYQPLLRFVQRLTRIRRRLRVFRRETFLKGVQRAGYKDVTWLRAAGGEMRDEDWQQAHLRTIGIKFANPEGAGTRVLLLMNAGQDTADFALPASPAAGWRLVFDTASEARGEGRDAQACIQGVYRLESHSTVLLED